MTEDNHNYCRRSRHSFNPAPGSVKRSDLLGVCHGCQAETVLEWHNREAFARGERVYKVHIGDCPERNYDVNFYRRMDDNAIKALMKECGI